jgi:hypothetical protein
MGAYILTRRKLLGGLAAAGAGLTVTLPASRAEVVLAETQSIDIEARPITSFARSETKRRFGELEFRGGLLLTSPSPHFGGLSGIVTDPAGRKFLMLSDRGAWLSAELSYEGESPVRFSSARIGPMETLGGRSLKNKREQDAESLALLDGTLDRGTVVVGFERLHRIGRYPVRNGELARPSGYVKLPPEAKGMPKNQGLEALTVLSAGPLRGSMVAFAERFTRGSGYHTGWIWVRGEPRAFHLQDVDGFNVTDVAGLPDGGLLVLERYFRWTSGVKMRMRRLTPDEVKPGARVKGRTLIEVGADHEIDNMEGLCVHKGARGDTVVSLISDDNFNRFLQRTVFLQFTLSGE